MNNCSFTGKLGKDWDVRYSSDGKCIAKNTMAVKKYNKETQWVNIVAFSKSGETLSQYTGKGSDLSICAEYSSQEYEKDGQKKYFHEFLINKFTFIGGRAQNNQNQSTQNNQQGYQNQQQNQYDGSEIPF